MSPTRRTFVQQVTGAAIAGTIVSTLTAATAGAGAATPSEAPIGAVLFDAFPVLDPRPVATLAEQEFPGHGAALMETWRSRQFEYQWLRTITGDYADFWRCTDDALRFAAASLRLELTPARRDRLMRAHRELRPWPDAPAALHALRDHGVRLGFLSNFTPAMLDDAIRRGGLVGLFEHVLSTDRARTFKPDPRAYRLGADALRLPRTRILFAAFAGWDAAGATRFGYPTYWVNRLGAPPEELGTAPPVGTGETLTDLAAFVSATR
jgi:2-haloacid dehalogenase